MPKREIKNKRGPDKSGMLHVRLSIEELSKIRLKADASGLTVSHYVRIAALEAPVIHYKVK